MQLKMKMNKETCYIKIFLILSSFLSLRLLLFFFLTGCNLCLHYSKNSLLPTSRNVTFEKYLPTCSGILHIFITQQKYRMSPNRNVTFEQYLPNCFDIFHIFITQQKNIMSPNRNVTFEKHPLIFVNFFGKDNIIILVYFISAKNMSLSKKLRRTMDSPPPRLPTGFNTRLWPRYHGYAPPEMVGKSIEEQLVELHLERHQQERDARRMHQHEWADHMVKQCDRPGLRKPFCAICSCTITRVKLEMSPVYHRHYSSMSLRVNYPTSILEAKGRYHCFNCEIVEHGCMQGARIPVILSSSTMADWATDAKKLGMYSGTPFHIDMLTVPGATIKELTHAMWSEYQEHPAPLDIVVFAGLNNLLQNQSLEQIKYEIRKAKEDLEYMTPGNTVAFASILYPPMLSILPCDPKDKWPKDFYDRTGDIKELNRFIFLMNRSGEFSDCSILAPKCQTYGLRIVKSGTVIGILGRVNAHNLAAWRENKVSEMLHLKPEQKLKIGKSVVSYFSYLYGIKENSLRTRQEQIETDRVEELEAERINEVILKNGLDARKAINMRKAKRLEEEVTIDQWEKTEENEWRLWNAVEEEYILDKVETDEEGNITRHPVQRDDQGEYFTCYQDAPEQCRGCDRCDNMAVKLVVEQGRRHFNQ